MVRALTVGAFLFLGACTDGGGFPDDTDTSDDTEGCPENMRPARNPGMLISTYRINGLDRSPLFDDGEYQGRPAGCIGDDGMSVDYLFLLLGDPYGRVAMNVPGSNASFDLNDTTSPTATIEIEIFGETGSPTFENGEWVSGSWFVSSAGASFDSDMNGNGLDDDGGSNSLSIQLTIQGDR